MLDSEIIDKRLLFYGFEHFFKRRLIIKALLATKTREEKKIYRWYLYAAPFITDTVKNYMWDYLQGYIDESTFYTVYRKYGPKNKDTE